jgi:hypothetical protein
MDRFGEKSVHSQMPDLVGNSQNSLTAEMYPNLNQKTIPRFIFVRQS